jgi:hypothetical protein
MVTVITVSEHLIIAVNIWLITELLAKPGLKPAQNLNSTCNTNC